MNAQIEYEPEMRPAYNDWDEAPRHNPQTQQPPVQTQPPAAQPYGARMYAPPPSGPRTVAFAIVGIMILLLGGMVSMSVGFMKDPEYDDYDSSDDYDKAQEEYAEKSRNIQTSGTMVQYVGLMIFSYGILMAAFVDTRLSAPMKLGLLISWGLIIGLKVGGTLLFYNF